MTFFILKLPQITSAVLAEDTKEACSSFYKVVKLFLHLD
jgi:hypothetical protein